MKYVLFSLFYNSQLAFYISSKSCYTSKSKKIPFPSIAQPATAPLYSLRSHFLSSFPIHREPILYFTGDRLTIIIIIYLQTNKHCVNYNPFAYVNAPQNPRWKGRKESIKWRIYIKNAIVSFLCIHKDTARHVRVCLLVCTLKETRVVWIYHRGSTQFRFYVDDAVRVQQHDN